jgi:hypothetical protein
VIQSGIHEDYVIAFAEPQELTIKEIERFLHDWIPLGLCWRVVQKWIDKYRRDRTNPAYNAVKEMVKDIFADGLNFWKVTTTRNLPEIRLFIRLLYPQPKGAVL